MKRNREIQKETLEVNNRRMEKLNEFRNEITARHVSDFDVLRGSHQFIRDDEKDEEVFESDHKVRMARRYYDRLFREYAIIDLSRCAEGMIGMRWRTEAEVLSGKGQVICAAKGCSSADELTSYEVPFKYSESGVSKMELVKCRLCNQCSGRFLQYKDKRSSVREDTAGSRKSHAKDIP
jgi:Folate-sensitive fragile site protein Fra10Ac1